MKSIIYIVACLGAGITALTELSHHFPVIMAICGGGSSGCADVANTPYSKVFGVSVAYWGLLSYIVFIGLARYAEKLALPMASFLVGAELYFLWVMASVIQIYCAFCLVQFVNVLLLFALTLAWRLKSGDTFAAPSMWAAPVIILVSFAGFAAPVKFAARPVAVSTGEYLTYEGDKNSPVRVELFSDYQCGYCKKLEPEIDKMRKEHPGILIVYRDFIINSHQLSAVAVSYANGVALTSGPEVFLAARKALFDNQDKLYDHLKARLPDINFTDELKGRINAKVEADRKLAESLGVYQTPTMLIYHKGELAQKVSGYAPYDQFSRFLPR